MPNIDVFKTRKGEPAVDLGGVGLVDDENGVPLERAAQRMRELQDEDGQPLTGKKLLEAAREYADRNGFQVGRGSDPLAEEAEVIAAKAAEAAEAADNDDAPSAQKES